MISKLSGTISDVFPTFIILEVGCVGYKVTISSLNLAKAKESDKVVYYIYTHVKEDALALYGFLSKKELNFFEMLLSVSNIGPKTALSVLNLGTVDEIMGAITRGDSDYFLSVPRIGRKNGQRIIVELRGKIGVLQDLDLTFAESKDNQEIAQVLIGFGFDRREIREVVKKLPKERRIEEKVKIALRGLGKNKTR